MSTQPAGMPRPRVCRESRGRDAGVVLGFCHLRPLGAWVSNGCARHADARQLEYRRDGQYLMPPTCWRFVGEDLRQCRWLKPRRCGSWFPQCYADLEPLAQGQDRRGSSRPRCERGLETACQAIRVNVDYLYQCLWSWASAVRTAVAKASSSRKTLTSRSSSTRVRVYPSRAPQVWHVSEARLETVRLQRGHGHQPAQRVQSLKREYSVYASSARRLIVRPAPRASRSVDAFVIVRLDRWSLRSVIGWLTFLSLPALPRNSRDTASSKLPFGAWEVARVYPGGDPARAAPSRMPRSRST